MQDVGLLGKRDPEVLKWAWTRISGPGLEGLIPLILLADFAVACEDCHAIDLSRVAGTEAEAGECTGR
jgi:hypothetical protein